MHVGMSKRLAGGHPALRRTHFVVRKDQIAAASLHVEACPQPIQCDGSAFDVPSRPPGTEYRLPARLSLPCVSPNQAVQGGFLAQPSRITASLGKQRDGLLLG